MAVGRGRYSRDKVFFEGEEGGQGGIGERLQQTKGSNSDVCTIFRKIALF